jgi:transposase
MAAAYSRDLRIRVLNDADAGLSSKQLAERYHVSRAIDGKAASEA